MRRIDKIDNDNYYWSVTLRNRLYAARAYRIVPRPSYLSAIRQGLFSGLLRQISIMRTLDEVKEDSA